MNSTPSDLELYYQWTIGFISDLHKETVEKIQHWVEVGQMEDDDYSDEEPQQERGVKCLG
jgi:hypothetical protein